MTTEIEKAATDNIDAFFGKLTEAADIVTKKLIEVTPEAADAILNLVQFKGAFTLNVTLVSLTIVLLSWRKFWKKVLPMTIKKEEENQSRHDSGFWWLLFSIANVLFGIAAIALFVSFLDFYDWLSAFYPEGAIALKALEAVGIKL